MFKCITNIHKLRFNKIILMKTLLETNRFLPIRKSLQNGMDFFYFITYIIN